MLSIVSERISQGLRNNIVIRYCILYIYYRTLIHNNVLAFWVFSIQNPERFELEQSDQNNYNNLIELLMQVKLYWGKIQSSDSPWYPVRDGWAVRGRLQSTTPTSTSLYFGGSKARPLPQEVD